MFIENKKLFINSILVFVFITLAAALVLITVKINGIASISNSFQDDSDRNPSEVKPWSFHNPKTGDPSVDESKLETEDEYMK